MSLLFSIPWSIALPWMVGGGLLIALFRVFQTFRKNIMTAEALRAQLKRDAEDSSLPWEPDVKKHEVFKQKRDQASAVNLSKMQFLWNVTTHKLLLANFTVLCLIAFLLAIKH